MPQGDAFIPAAAMIVDQCVKSVQGRMILEEMDMDLIVRAISDKRIVRNRRLALRSVHHHHGAVYAEIFRQAGRDCARRGERVGNGGIGRIGRLGHIAQIIEQDIAARRDACDMGEAALWQGRAQITHRDPIAADIDRAQQRKVAGHSCGIPVCHAEGRGVGSAVEVARAISLPSSQ